MGLNFNFLENSNPTLYELGSKMEENMFTDSAASIQYGSDFLNQMIKEIYRKEGMDYVYKSFFVKNIANLEREGIIDHQTYNLLEKAKLLRDYSIEKNGSTNRVLALRSILVNLASWFFNRYGGFDN